MGRRVSAPQVGYAAGIEQLRDPGFRRLFIARFISSFGSAMAPVAMAFGVLHLTGSATYMGVVIASQTASQVAVQLFAGALADRWSRKRLIVGGDILAATVQTAMAFLLFSGDAEVWQLCALMAVNGIAFALMWPAMVGLVPLVVPQERLQPANALLSLAQASAMGLGGAAAGMIVAFAGAGWAIAVDAATFAASGLLIAGIRPAAQTKSESRNLLHDMRDGWREFVSHRWLWAIVLQFSVLFAGWNGGFMIVGPVVADRHLGGPEDWGWIAGALGAGLLAGGALGMRLVVKRPMLVAVLACFGFAIPLALLALPAPVPVIAVGAFLAGVGGELFGVYWFTALHTHVAPEALSRVSAYDVVGSIALAPLGEALAGPAAEAIGTAATLWIAVGCITVPTLLVLLVPEVRRLGHAPAQATGAESGGSA